jgi:hypothetical protein
MSFFKPAENTMAYFKAGFMGEAGSGKTHTATIVAIGLVKLQRLRKIAGADKPVFMLDTENGSSWIKPMFDQAGIELRVAKTRAFKDLLPAIRDAEKNASVLFVDSITHFWEELQASYMKRMSEKRGRSVSRLEFQDWAFIKSQWRSFSDAFVTSNLHCILSGRLAWEYDHVEDDNGRKQIEKSGAKMQAEKGMGYEPNILVWMERDMDLHTKVVTRTATILKDRSRTLDGHQFPNPTFETFMPHIEFMALGGKHEAVNTARTSEDMIPTDDGPRAAPEMRAVQREIVIEEIQALMLKHYPSRADKDKKAKCDLLQKYFSTTSWTEVEKMLPLVDLQAAYDGMHTDLEGRASRYGMQVSAAGPLDDSIPHLDAPPPAEPVTQLEMEENEPPPVAAEAPAPEAGPEPAAVPLSEPDDIDTIILDFERDIAAAKTVEDRKRIWNDTADYREVMTDEQLARIKTAYGRALMSKVGRPPAGTRRAA